MLEEGSFRWSAPPLFQDGRRLDDKRVGRFMQFFWGLLGMTSGRFVSMISSAAHPTRPLRQPSWICFPSFIWRTPFDFFVPHWGVINHHHVPLLPKPCLPYTHRQHPTWGHMPRLALPLFWFLVYKCSPQGVLQGWAARPCGALPYWENFFSNLIKKCTHYCIKHYHIHV
jgi:hypothetical protein